MVHFFERKMGERRYRMVAQSVWDPVKGRSVARQVVLGPADPPPKTNLGETRTVGTQAVGDMGALLWVVEQINLVEHIDRERAQGTYPMADPRWRDSTCGGTPAGMCDWAETRLGAIPRGQSASPTFTRASGSVVKWRNLIHDERQTAAMEALAPARRFDGPTLLGGYLRRSGEWRVADGDPSLGRRTHQRGPDDGERVQHGNARSRPWPSEIAAIAAPAAMTLQGDLGRTPTGL
jgi:hypothetical protein